MNEMKIFNTQGKLIFQNRVNNNKQLVETITFVYIGFVNEKRPSNWEAFFYSIIANINLSTSTESHLVSMPGS